MFGRATIRLGIGPHSSFFFFSRKKNARLGRKVNFARGDIPSGGKSPRKCIYSVAAQETSNIVQSLVDVR